MHPKPLTVNPLFIPSTFIPAAGNLHVTNLLQCPIAPKVSCPTLRQFGRDAARFRPVIFLHVMMSLFFDLFLNFYCICLLECFNIILHEFIKHYGALCCFNCAIENIIS